ncbi:hydroxyisourate hydrolase [Nonomuraea sp. NN258]|uniref:hydroxyisourate hydrolase n=1 Tax=Nonomuraea antri TaxID=2730852 RepID=UPI0015685B9B|nr:hydroxyisourate hydrolase [Nonomuraea antri]NRQ35158.1 hydroxyisourate hydrolase [Nonomuraea antri]
MGINVQALDSIHGRSVAGMRVGLEVRDQSWSIVAKAKTDRRGSVREWDAHRLPRGLYRVVFDSDHYFAGLGLTAAYPEINVLFRICDEGDSYRIHVLISPYSYSIFCGSQD